MTPSKDISRLIEIMAALRDPDTGCPWDQQQTFATIAPYTIEEAYEVADAIARGDLAHLKDELGDLLLQVVYHARMAEERRRVRLRRRRRGGHDQDDPPPPARVRHGGRARRRRQRRLLGSRQGDGEDRTMQRRRSRRRARHPPRADARHQVAEQSRQGRLRLAVAGAGVRQAQRGDRRARGGDRRDEGQDPTAPPSRRSSATCCSSSPTSRAT